MSYFNVFLSVNLFSEVLVEESFFFFFLFSHVCFSLRLFVVIGNATSTAFSLQLSFCQASSVLIYSPW